LEINKKQNYLNNFKPSNHSFPSQGQIYFAQEVEQYNEDLDVNRFLEPLIAAVKTIPIRNVPS